MSEENVVVLIETLQDLVLGLRGACVLSKSYGSWKCWLDTKWL